MKIAIASDHGALELKAVVKQHLILKKYDVIDFGTNTNESCDYPDYAYLAASAVKDKIADLGIVMCTTGIGVSIVANKVKGIRCALVSSVFQAEMTKKHNNTNVLALGSKNTDINLSLQIIDTWLSNTFEGGRHLNRVNKITEIEDKENE